MRTTLSILILLLLAGCTASYNRNYYYHVCLNRHLNGLEGMSPPRATQIVEGCQVFAAKAVETSILPRSNQKEDMITEMTKEQMEELFYLLGALEGMSQSVHEDADHYREVAAELVQHLKDVLSAMRLSWGDLRHDQGVVWLRVEGMAM